MKKVNNIELEKTVLAGGYCSGCGVCTATSNSPFKMKMTENGNYLPIQQTDEVVSDIVCPFADHNIDENQLSSERFKDEKEIEFDSIIGYYSKVYAGFVKVSDYRNNGSSGGGVSWLCDKLLKSEEVNYVIHVTESKNRDSFYEYTISKNSNDLNKGAKSRYYPITLEKVLQFIRNNDGNYALVGIPCFIKGVQLLCKQENIFEKRIKYFISIVCGHLKTTHYFESLIAQFDLDTSIVDSFNFRHKIKGNSATHYGTLIKTKDGNDLIKLNNNLFGTNWGLNLFKLKACDYCDDVIGESADISFGDAWLPQYLKDYKGNNIITVRNNNLKNIIEDAIENDELTFDELKPKDMFQSQAGGYRHRREGLQHRLFLNEKNDVWTPKKRFPAKKEKNRRRAKIYENRIDLRNISFDSKFYNDVEKFQAEIADQIKLNDELNKPGLFKRLKFKFKQVIDKFKNEST